MTDMAIGTKPHLTIDAALARRSYGQRSFTLGHDLADHPLFTLDALAELAERLPEDSIEKKEGNSSVVVADADARDQVRSAADIVRTLEDQPGWVTLPTTIPGLAPQAGYQELFEELLVELAPMTGQPAASLLDHHAVILVSSGGNTTPVHVDPEPSFLMHIRGTKRFSIGRHPDPEAERIELEEFYGHRLRNSPQEPVDVEHFDLAPGQAVHVPPVQPHWVTNGSDGVCVSFSVGFQTAADHRRRGVYQFNGRARKLGLTPKPYGDSPLRDRIKGGMMGTAFEARRRILRRPS